MTCTFSRSTVLRFAALSSGSQACPRHDEKRWILHSLHCRQARLWFLQEALRHAALPHTQRASTDTDRFPNQGTTTKDPSRFDCGGFPVRDPYPLFGQSYMQAITSITLALMMTCSTRNWWWLS